MKIAVDVKGTLEGYRRAQIVAMLEIFITRGHSVTVWSNSLSYAFDAQKKLQAYLDENYDNAPQVDFMSKASKYEMDEDQHFDFAFEDDRVQEYLAAKNFIWVDTIPENIEEAKELARSML